MHVDAGSVEELQKSGCLTTKVGSQPVCVFWHDGRAYGIDDRCPHLGFPLHRGTVESGLVTCHWHHARFDLCTGATLDPFADDARAYDVALVDGRVLVTATAPAFDRGATLRRIDDGLEQGLTLVLAKAVLGLLAEGEDPRVVLAAGARFGCRFRAEGFGPGLTVLCAMGNVLDRLDPEDRPLALVQGLRFVSDDTRGHGPRFPLPPLGHPGASVPVHQLPGWYRRFVDTRSGDAAERALATAVAGGFSDAQLCRMMGAAATDHVFLDEGHVIDFTNKAFELVDHLSGGDGADASLVLSSLVHQTADAVRHEEEGEWRHPDNLAALAATAASRLEDLFGAGGSTGWSAAASDGSAAFEASGRVGALGWEVLGEDPAEVVEALFQAIEAGASAEQLARAVAFAAALRLTRFHVQNDHGDWDVVHHGFTSANAVHQLVVRAPSPLLLRGVVHGALKVFLDRFLNVPAARLPSVPPAEAGAVAPGDRAALLALDACWDREGGVDQAGSIVYGYLASGGRRQDVVAVLGHALLHEDAGFHWFQTFEAATRQAFAWPEGSDESALILAGAARFLAAHTPTRRELAQVVRIAGRLRRGEALYAEDENADGTVSDTIDGTVDGTISADAGTATGVTGTDGLEPEPAV
jgi:nitrite reductase/ring-hydroxylating ferredoxin subunit